MTTTLRAVLLLLVFAALPAIAQSASDEETRWRNDAADTSIVRDDWGIAHIHGKTDADTVFGMIYAQAEDDFNRVETNYLNAMGRLAEAEGESAVYQDLRMKLFIRPEELKTHYAASPAWLQKLMQAWAGLGSTLLSALAPPGDAAGAAPGLRAVDGARVHRGQHRR